MSVDYDTMMVLLGMDAKTFEAVNETLMQFVQEVEAVEEHGLLGADLDRAETIRGITYTFFSRALVSNGTFWLVEEHHPMFDPDSITRHIVIEAGTPPEAFRMANDIFRGGFAHQATDLKEAIPGYLWATQAHGLDEASSCWYEVRRLGSMPVDLKVD